MPKPKELRFPQTDRAEVSHWLEIQAHESQHNLEIDSELNFGETIGEPIYIVAPNSIVENNTHQYTTQGFALSGAGHDFIKGQGNWKELGKDAIMSLVGGVSEKLGAEISMATREVANPREEEIYKSPAFRSFTFHWELTPLSNADASSLEEIYRTLRKYSYPTLGSATNPNGTSIRMKMPHEFRLAHVFDDGMGSVSENKAFGSYGKCVIKNIALNYTGAGIAQNWWGAEGAPPFLNLDINFAETTLKHQESPSIKD